MIECDRHPPIAFQLTNAATGKEAFLQRLTERLCEITILLTGHPVEQSSRVGTSLLRRRAPRRLTISCVRDWCGSSLVAVQIHDVRLGSWLNNTRADTGKNAGLIVRLAPAFERVMMTSRTSQSHSEEQLSVPLACTVDDQFAIPRDRR